MSKNAKIMAVLGLLALCSIDLSEVQAESIIIFDGSQFPEEQGWQTFQSGYYISDYICSIEANDIFRMDSTNGMDIIAYYYKDIDLCPQFTYTARLRIIESGGHNSYDASFCLAPTSVGSSIERSQMLYIDEEEIGFSDLSGSYRMDTTDDFHIYSLQVETNLIKVFVDGQEVLRRDAPVSIKGSVAWGDQTNDYYLNCKVDIDYIKYECTCEPPTLGGLEIIGPSELAENSLTKYTAIANYNCGHTGDVTTWANWSIEPQSIGNFEGNGVLKTGRIKTSDDVTLYAQYTFGDITADATKIVHISPLIDLEITGPEKAKYNCPEQYSLTAYYANGHTSDVTNFAFWWVEPSGIATIESGILKVKDIDYDQYATVHAQYTSGGATVEVEEMVQFLASRKLYVPSDYHTIQEAIDSAECGDEIIVAPSTYTGEGNWDIDFLGKAITVRSENGPENCIIDCNDTEDYHYGFYFHNDEDANSIVAGFTITNSGGAIRCYSSPTITNCTISGNAAKRDGGGIYCSDGSPTITYCTITGNTAEEGGGIYCEYCISPTITNCIISGNSAISRHGGGNGGGIYYDIVDPWLYEDYIINPKITSCIITGNMTGENGGGVYLQGYGSIKMTNCTITGNSAGYNGGGIWCEYSSPAITNSIVWGNTDSSGQGQPAQLYDGKSEVWFSCIQDDNPDDANVPFGEEQFNIDDDPCFVEPGYWDVNGLWVDGDYHLLAGSPCIETGDPYSTYHAGDVDMDAQPRVMGLCVDIGADEFELSAIVVTKPKGGEIWAAGSTHEIKWDSYNISGTVDIYYSTNNGADWVIIDNSVTDTGNFIWHLPSEVDSDQCLVSVEPSVPDPNIACAKSGLFAIYPDFIHPTVPSKWKSLGGDFDRAGLSQNYGPELGCVKWQFQTDGPVSASPTIGAGDRIHIACEDGKLYTLDPDGSLVWTYDVNSPLLSSPSVGPSGSVYVGSQDGKLYAISIAGRLRWTHSTDGFIYSSPAVSADGNVYVCSQDGTLYALSQDGSELWSFETGGLSVATGGAIFASPAIDPNENVYIAGVYDPNLCALDSNDGSVRWSCTFLDPCDPNGKRPWPFASPVIAEDGAIYQALLYDPNLYAIDPNTADVIWSTNLADPCSGWFEPDYNETYHNASCWSEPALAPDGTIYVSFDDPYLRAVDPDGTIKWVTRLGMMGGFTLTVGSDGFIYAASDDAHLCVIDPSGEEIARFEGDGELSFPVITADNTMIVSDANNTIWAIGGDDCEGQVATLHWPEDLNGDRTVNSIDLAVLAADWLDRTDTYWPCGFEEDQVYLEGDIDKDLYVDFADLARLANRWLTKE